jgi:hypothetical protein
MIAQVGLGVNFNIHNLSNQRYFVAANGAGAFSTEPPPAVWAEPVEDLTVATSFWLPAAAPDYP